MALTNLCHVLDINPWDLTSGPIQEKNFNLHHIEMLGRLFLYTVLDIAKA